MNTTREEQKKRRQVTEISIEDRAKISSQDHIQRFNHKAMIKAGIRDISADELMILSWASQFYYGNSPKGKIYDQLITRSVNIYKGKRHGREQYVKFFLFDFQYFIDQHFCLFTDSYSTNQKRISKTLMSMEDKKMILKESVPNKGKNRTYLAITEEWQQYFSYRNSVASTP